MVAVVAAVLALAGAPANTTVACNPAMRDAGLTHYQRTPPLIELNVTACSALLLAGMSPGEYARVRTLNPAVNLDARVGVGLLVFTHEAFHAGLRSGDENLVECHAIAAIRGLLDRYGPNPAAELAYAVASDAALPADYKRGC